MVIVFYLIWSLFMLIIMIVPNKSTRFLTDNFQRIFILVTWACLGGLTWGLVGGPVVGEA